MNAVKEKRPKAQIGAKKMNVHCFQHVPFEGLGNIEEWIALSKHHLRVTRIFAGEGLPEADDVDFLIVMGGPMSVNDEARHPWLAGEKAFIASAIRRGIKVLGICLGAQLIASALGAKVYPNACKEIGWFPIRLTPEGRSSSLFEAFPDEFTVFHWHGDTFDLPAGAIHLASSAGCRHQAFSYQNHVLALQFHLDVRRDDIAAWIKNGAGELTQDGPYIHTPETLIRPGNPFERISSDMKSLLTTFEKRIP